MSKNAIGKSYLAVSLALACAVREGGIVIIVSRQLSPGAIGRLHENSAPRTIIH